MAAPSQPRSRQSQEVREGLAVARTLRQELGLRDDQPVPCMLKIAEQRLALEVVLAPLRSAVSGFYFPEPRPLIVVNAGHPVVRQRFTLAHEIAHHAMGHGAAPRIIEAPGSGAADPTTVVASHYTAVRSTDPIEKAANTFAAELIAPIDGVKALIAGWADQDPLDQVVRVSSHYGLSAFSTVFKFKLLGRFDETVATATTARLVDQEHVPRYEALGLVALDDELQRHHDAGGGARCTADTRRLLGQMRAEVDAAT